MGADHAQFQSFGRGATGHADQPQSRAHEESTHIPDVLRRHGSVAEFGECGTSRSAGAHSLGHGAGGAEIEGHIHME